MFYSSQLFCQQRFQERKISPGLLQTIKSGKIAGKYKFIIAIAGNVLPYELGHLKAEQKKTGDYPAFSFFEIQVTVDDLLSVILPVPEVIFVEDASRRPKEELRVSNLDLSANKINLVHRRFPQWNGEGITVSVKENKPDTTDIDFAGRFLTTNLASPIVSGHASIMSTMIAGAGNTWHLGKGAAWGSTISSSNFASLLPDAISAYRNYSISVQNHSYGVGIENFYGADAADYDATTISEPSLLHVFSSGNSGNSASTTGMYSGLAGFANLTGSFKMAKNSLVVGATDSFGIVAAISSKGPAHDGRVKPELVAFGEEGSSGAAALVSGTALLMQHQYKQLYGYLPTSSLVKAVLINSADDAGNKEVDHAYGYGNLNAFKAMSILQSQQFMTGSVSNSGTQSFSLSVPPGIKKLKLTLVWHDPPASPNATRALVNDLDLELFHLSTGQAWKPWVLNTFPHQDSLRQLASRKKDSLNNVEQITVENPLTGIYELRVTGFHVPVSSQNFHIAYQFDSTDVFEWHFPVNNNFTHSGLVNTVRWSSSFDTATAALEYSLNNGNSWQIINTAVNLANGYYRWNTPDLTSTALLRMTISGNNYTSDTFTISKRTITKVGFNCPDSFLFYWQKLPGTTEYRIYRLGSKYLEPFKVTADSFIVLSKNLSPSLHYAVAPIIGNGEGMKSYTFNYKSQGVECYIRSFLSSSFNNIASLDLLLGTLYGINRIVLEKFDGTTYQPIQQLTTFPGLLINFIDPHPTKGVNIYRIKLELAGGSTAYSQPESVYYFPADDFIVYPNPVQQNQLITILANDVFEPAILQVINANGQKLYEITVGELVTQLPSGRLSKGLYLFRFIKKGKQSVVLKVLVK